MPLTWALQTEKTIIPSHNQMNGVWTVQWLEH